MTSASPPENSLRQGRVQSSRTGDMSPSVDSGLACALGFQVSESADLGHAHRLSSRPVGVTEVAIVSCHLLFSHDQFATVIVRAWHLPLLPQPSVGPTCLLFCKGRAKRLGQELPSGALVRLPFQSGLFHLRGAGARLTGAPTLSAAAAGSRGNRGEVVSRASWHISALPLGAKCIAHLMRYVAALAEAVKLLPVAMGDDARDMVKQGHNFVVLMSLKGRGVPLKELLYPLRGKVYQVMVLVKSPSPKRPQACKLGGHWVVAGGRR